MLTYIDIEDWIEDGSSEGWSLHSAMNKVLQKYGLTVERLVSKARCIEPDVLSPEIEYRKATEDKKHDITCIASSAEWSFMYAKFIRKRFKLGEHSILTSPTYAYRYAEEVIGGRWIEAERTIASDPFSSLAYATNVIGGRFIIGEDAIKKSPSASSDYVFSILRKRSSSFEASIKKSPSASYQYALTFIKGRFKEGEPAINSCPVYSKLYTI